VQYASSAERSRPERYFAPTRPLFGCVIDAFHMGGDFGAPKLSANDTVMHVSVVQVFVHSGSPGEVADFTNTTSLFTLAQPTPTQPSCVISFDETHTQYGLKQVRPSVTW